LALDEPRPSDTLLEEAGLPFLFDRKSITLVGQLVIDYDDHKGFTLYDEALGQGPNDCD